MTEVQKKRLLGELYKVKREIALHGRDCEVYRKETDEYGETTENKVFIACVRGLFHTQKGFLTRSRDDATEVRTKGQPMLLLDFEDAQKFLPGDILIVGEKEHRVIAFNDIQLFNIVVDVSLEEVLKDGSQYNES